MAKIRKVERKTKENFLFFAFFFLEALDAHEAHEALDALEALEALDAPEALDALALSIIFKNCAFPVLANSGFCPVYRAFLCSPTIFKTRTFFVGFRFSPLT